MGNKKIGGAGVHDTSIDWKSIQVAPIKKEIEARSGSQLVGTAELAYITLNKKNRELTEKYLANEGNQEAIENYAIEKMLEKTK